MLFHWIQPLSLQVWWLCDAASQPHPHQRRLVLHAVAHLGGRHQLVKAVMVACVLCLASYSIHHTL